MLSPIYSFLYRNFKLLSFGEEAEEDEEQDKIVSEVKLLVWSTLFILSRLLCIEHSLLQDNY